MNLENYHSVTGPLRPEHLERITKICAQFRERGYDDLRKLAYILATVKHETANTFLPIEEIGKGAGRNYGREINGRRYYGRGYVQLTWIYNYELMSKQLSLDLVNNPDLALREDVALDILFIGMHKGLFTGRRLEQYFNEFCEDPISARKIINGKDRAKMIAGYYYEFKRALI